VVRRLLACGPDALPAAEDVRVVTDVARGVVRSSHVAEHVDADDLAQDLLMRILELARDGRGERIERPGAFLWVMARNAAMDRVRRARHGPRLSDAPEGPPDRPADDDAIARLLDRDASSEAVERALRAAVAGEDHLTVRVVAAWLDLAEERGEPPSSRDVAPRAGVSHTTVNHALARFRGYLAG
jgi:DNA-directed RNA polymerase specialized sigma24 family protein